MQLVGGWKLMGAPVHNTHTHMHSNAGLVIKSLEKNDISLRSSDQNRFICINPKHFEASN